MCVCVCVAEPVIDGVLQSVESGEADVFIKCTVGTRDM